MKNYKALSLLLFIALIFTSCFEDNDDNQIAVSSINDFVWKGMNSFYLYKDDIPDLANNRFANNEELKVYLNSFNSPEGLFESLIHQRETIDRFSWIVDDYIALEQFFDGVVTNNGMEFQVFRFSTTDTNRYGIVTHVLPNTSAEANGVKRGDIFYGIDNVQLTANNANALLSADNYTINLGVYDDNDTTDTSDDSVTETSETIALTKEQYTENPILINKVLNIANKNIAYLMYNGFTGTEQFNAELNSVFANFNSAGATELVLDLRYNPGGSVSTAIMLSSLITGQFTGEIYSTEQWNSEIQEALETENPELLINRFVSSNNGAALQSLNLDRLFVLTTNRSASASELVINSLRPYIDVVQIGTTTAGKYQASTTLYDSDNFRREGANPSHTYAMQPLIFKSLNVEGVTDYFDGLEPDITLSEKVRNLGVLGDENEPLLAEALAIITGTGKPQREKGNSVIMSDKKINSSPFEGNMYIDKDLPIDLIKKTFFE
ncbi:S41 family peptidase [Postechiella marina]